MCFIRRCALFLLMIVLALPGVAQAQFLSQDTLPGWDQGDGSPLYQHWERPIPSQGTPLKALSPSACGKCHTDKLQDWSGSQHARAMSEGVVGQLMTYRTADRSLCMDCHAPLAEQFAEFEDSLAKDTAPKHMDLALSGNVCSGCHMRKGKIFGPTGGLGEDAPHGKTSAAPWLKNPLFCAACHQFPQAWAVNGKPLLNTYAEWKASPQAKEGQTCQTCHMPGRQHLWRGIHDPKTVEAGLTAKVTQDADGVRFTLTNSGVGHDFPTYITPKVTMYAVGLDGQGRVIPETLISRIIHRTVRQTQGKWVELSDTRIKPGESQSLFIDWQEDFRGVRIWLQVDPDHYYTNHFYDEVRLVTSPGSQADKLIGVAQSKGEANRYKLFEADVSRSRF